MPTSRFGWDCIKYGRTSQGAYFPGIRPIADSKKKDQGEYAEKDNGFLPV